MAADQLSSFEARKGNPFDNNDHREVEAAECELVAPGPHTGPVVFMSPLPRRPVLEWSCLFGRRNAGVPSVADLPSIRMTSSGRAAIFQALKLSSLLPETPVLVPTYHCPTIVAPVILAGLQPIYYPIGIDGLPLLERIADADAMAAGAIVVPHFFGRGQSLLPVRDWCDQTDTLLIEDCAHTFYGMAGERPVGAWGDFATASMSKFFPMLEGGMLASSNRSIPDLALASQSHSAQIKGVFDILHRATSAGRMRGLGWLVAAANAARAGLKMSSRHVSTPSKAVRSELETFMFECNMGRKDRAPLAASTLIARIAPQSKAIEARRRNYRLLLDGLPNHRRAYPLIGDLTESMVPYVFPYWVSDASAVYEELLAGGAPVYRWDRSWPGTPRLDDDRGGDWSEHVIQIVCHQALRPSEIVRTINLVTQATMQLEHGASTWIRN